jgi:hypothetical protein
MRLAVRRFDQVLSADKLSAPPTGLEPRRRRQDARRASFTKPPCLATACVVRVFSAEQEPPEKSWPRDPLFALLHFDHPERALDSGQVGLVCDSLVPEEFCPGAVRRVTQVLNGAFAFTVPPGRWLRRPRPQECVFWAGLSEPESYVANPGPRRASASSTTSCASSSLFASMSRRPGVAPSSCFRGRSNQRLMPYVLYADRSDERMCVMT